MPFNPAIERLMPNLRYRNDGIQVRKIMATKFAPTKTAIRMRTIGCPKTPRSVDRRFGIREVERCVSLPEGV